jgi:mono/diheme cytochrome c family protein
MKRVLKWVGYVVGVIVVLLIVAVSVVYALGSSRLNKSYPLAVEPVAVPADPASVARGKHLVEAVGKCQSCHGDDYSGKIMFDNPAFGSLASANLTSGKGGVGGTFSNDDYVRAIRHGIGKDGKSLMFMPAEAFTYFNDPDLGAIIAYLKSIPPAPSTVTAKRTAGPVARALGLLTTFPLYAASRVPAITQRPVVPEGATKEYGEYLSKAGGCTSCHNSALSGGAKIEGVAALNLTPGGEVGSWTEADFTKALRTGVRPDGRILSAVMPWPYAKNMTDDEIRAMWLYIHTLPAKKLGEI